MGCAIGGVKMMVGLDRSFKPRWVYNVLKLAKPGMEFRKSEPTFMDIVEYEGLRSKENVLTIITRYYLQLDRKNGKYYFSDNYLHDLSLEYSYESLKPLLLFTLLLTCPIARFLQGKINLLFKDQELVDSKILLKHTQKEYGDRKIVKYAVGYYLTILSYFDVLEKNKSKYTWKNHKLSVSDQILKEMLLVYSQVLDRSEIDISCIHDDIAFSLFDINNLDDILMEYNAVDWVYQKRVATRKIIITKKFP